VNSSLVNYDRWSGNSTDPSANPVVEGGEVAGWTIESGRLEQENGNKISCLCILV